MKITDIQTFLVDCFRTNWAFVKVSTDEGLTGVGEATLEYKEHALEGAVAHLREALLGKNPLDIEAIYHDACRDAYWRGGAVLMSALSAVEMALWDILGKFANLPVYRLLGGKVRYRIAVYFWGPGDDAETMIRQHGIRAFKMGIDVGVTERGDPSWRLDPGKRSHWTVTNREIDAIVRSVQNARERVGPDVELGVECHTRYNTESAIQIGRAIAPFRPMWLEEPIPSDNLDAMALVRRSIPVPVACGENIYTRYGYRQVMEKQAAAIIQPDMTKCGGLLETRKIASLAEIYHVDLAPHGTASPLAGMAYAHVCATVPNFLILEFGHLLRQQSAPLRALLRNQPRYEKGFVHIPEAPGIGIEVNDDAIRENLAPGFRWS